LEILDAEVDINRAWETIMENIKIPAKESLDYYDLKKHKPWFNEGSKETSQPAMVTGSKRNKRR
jgi:hypothetical protein